MVTSFPVAELSLTRSDGADQLIAAFARAGYAVTLTAASVVPVRTVGDTMWPAPPLPPEGAALATDIRNTSLPLSSYFARTFAGSQSSTGPESGARSRFHGLNAFTSSSLSSRDSL